MSSMEDLEAFLNGKEVEEEKEVIEIDGNKIDVDSSEFAKAIVAKKKEIADLESKYESTRNRKRTLEDQKKILQEKLDMITVELGSISVELYDYQKNKRRLQREYEDLLRKLRLEIEKEVKSKEFQQNWLDYTKNLQQYKYAPDIMEHQKEGAFYLATNERCILGDKRGSGKTLTAIATCDMAQAQRVLVIVPDDVVSNFVNEIAYWAPHRNVIQLGKMTPMMRTVALEAAQSIGQFTMVLNYSAWRKDKGLLDKLIELHFDAVILDEAHELKNTSTSAFRGVRRIVHAENACPRCKSKTVKQESEVLKRAFFDACTVCSWTAHDTDYVLTDRFSCRLIIPMTGTPILNKPQDLYSLLHLVDPINFDSEYAFLSSYCSEDPYTSRWKFREGGLKSLQKNLGGKYIAREGVSTPGQSIYHHDLTLDPAEYPLQHKVIEQLSKHAQIILDSGAKLPILYTIALITRKRQANVWPGGITLKNEKGETVFRVDTEVQESIKVDKCIKYNRITNELTGLIPEFTDYGSFDTGSNVVVFSQFKGPLIELERRLTAAGIKAVRFDGETPQHIRDQVKIDFDRRYREAPGYEPKWQVVLANYKVGGVGLNFTAATEMILLDKEWNPGKEDQALGRIDRMGQTEHTNVHIIRINNTIDGWMDKLNEEKLNMISGFESAANVSDDLLAAMKSGEVL